MVLSIKYGMGTSEGWQITQPKALWEWTPSKRKKKERRGETTLEAIGEIGLTEAERR